MSYRGSDNRKLEEPISMAKRKGNRANQIYKATREKVEEKKKRKRDKRKKKKEK